MITMNSDLVRHRVELKYRASSAAAEALVASLESAGPEFRRQTSWITTIYLDLPDRRLLRAARPGSRTAVKLRLRTYFDAGGEECSPLVWMELKEREGDGSRKWRFPLPAGRVPEFLQGTLDPSEILDGPHPDPDAVLETVRRIRALAPGPLSPVGAVRYRRFSLQGGDPCARITVDRHIAYHVGAPVTHPTALGAPEVCEDGAVVEVKHAPGPRPPWCDRLLGRRTPVEYSKFGRIARLLSSEAFAR